MSLRSLRRRFRPQWLSAESLRQFRAVLLRHAGLARCRHPRVLARRPDLVIGNLLQRVVADQLLRTGNCTFLQIGAYDGRNDELGELIRRYGLSGVMVEPQPGAFARLQAAYRDQPQVTLLNAAIADEEGTRPLFVPRTGDATTASFDRRHLIKHGWREADIEAREVPCHTVAGALAAAGLEQVDLIQIDAEGYDAQILRSIDFDRLRPAILRFEYRHIRRAEADACLLRLAEHGYRFLLEERDIIACLEEANRKRAGRTPARDRGCLQAASLRTAKLELSPLVAYPEDSRHNVAAE